MKIRTYHTAGGPDGRRSVRAGVEPVGIWGARSSNTASTTVELLGLGGAATTLVQHPDGSIEIRTEAMSSAGRAVRVAPTGSARPIIE